MCLNFCRLLLIDEILVNSIDINDEILSSPRDDLESDSCLPKTSNHSFHGMAPNFVGESPSMNLEVDDCEAGQDLPQSLREVYTTRGKIDYIYIYKTL